MFKLMLVFKTVLNFFYRKRTGKMPLGTPRSRWDNNIIIGLKEYVSEREIGLIRFRLGILGDPL